MLMTLLPFGLSYPDARTIRPKPTCLARQHHLQAQVHRYLLKNHGVPPALDSGLLSGLLPLTNNRRSTPLPITAVAWAANDQQEKELSLDIGHRRRRKMTWRPSRSEGTLSYEPSSRHKWPSTASEKPTFPRNFWRRVMRAILADRTRQNGTPK